MSAKIIGILFKTMQTNHFNFSLLINYGHWRQNTGLLWNMQQNVIIIESMLNVHVRVLPVAKLDYFYRLMIIIESEINLLRMKSP